MQPTYEISNLSFHGIYKASLDLSCPLVLVFPSPDRETQICLLRMPSEGFPGGAVVKNLPANARDTGSSSGSGRSHMPWSN